MLAKRWFQAILAVVVLGAIGLGWFILQIFPLGSPGPAVVMEVFYGDGMSTIASKLQSEGIISSKYAFDFDTLLQGSLIVRPGAYSIAQGSSFAHIRAVLAHGPNVASVVVTPGLSLHEIETSIQDQEGSAFENLFATAAARAAQASPYHPNNSLEGLIGPGIYVISPGESATVLLSAMQKSFVREAATAGLSPSSHLNGLNAYQLLIGASIVDKEGYYPINMGKVARVILNRLARHDALQMDSTVLYALHRDGGVVTPAMLETNTRYNTYRYAGLTPTPICVVSLQALAAMLKPPAGPWEYFVLVDKQGKMAFSTTYSQQLANEALARRAGL